MRGEIGDAVIVRSSFSDYVVADVFAGRNGVTKVRWRDSGMATTIADHGILMVIPHVP